VLWAYHVCSTLAALLYTHIVPQDWPAAAGLVVCVCIDGSALLLCVPEVEGTWMHAVQGDAGPGLQTGQRTAGGSGVRLRPCVGTPTAIPPPSKSSTVETTDCTNNSSLEQRCSGLSLAHDSLPAPAPPALSVLRL